MPSTSSPLAAIQAALDNFLTGRESNIAFPNVDFNPQPGTPYLASKIAARTAMVIGVGRNAPIQHTGVYQVSVNYPKGIGLADMLAKADIIAGYFTLGLTIAAGSSNIIIQNVRTPPEVQSENWVTVPVMIDWLYIQS